MSKITDIYSEDAVSTKRVVVMELIQALDSVEPTEAGYRLMIDLALDRLDRDVYEPALKTAEQLGYAKGMLRMKELTRTPKVKRKDNNGR